MFNPWGEFRWSPEGPITQIHFPNLHVGAPGIFSHLLRSVQMLKREECGKQRKATATLVPEFAMEDLPMGRTAALVPEFAWKTCTWAEHSDDDDDDDDDM